MLLNISEIIFVFTPSCIQHLMLNVTGIKNFLVYSSSVVITRELFWASERHNLFCRTNQTLLIYMYGDWFKCELALLDNIFSLPKDKKMFEKSCQLAIMQLIATRLDVGSKSTLSL
jgi:hypothetical protein